MSRRPSLFLVLHDINIKSNITTSLIMSLDDKYRIDVITKEAFADALKDYQECVPFRAYDFETPRYVTIPKSVTARKESGKPNLGKTEVVTLVDWKLSHGTFRPKLKQLVQTNPPEVVKKTTAAAFSSFDGSLEKVKSSLKELSTLKGIGPATASLLLSVAFPSTVPFFSDELYRWAFWEEGKGKGWDRPIKYSAKEYHDLYSKVQELQERHGWLAVDIEKMAYVLGYRASHKSILTPEEESSIQIVGQYKAKLEAREKIAKKRAGLDLEESPPPSKKTKAKAENSKVTQIAKAEEPAKGKATKAKAIAEPKASTPGKRSSSRLKEKAS